MEEFKEKQWQQQQTLNPSETKTGVACFSYLFYFCEKKNDTGMSKVIALNLSSALGARTCRQCPYFPSVSTVYPSLHCMVLDFLQQPRLRCESYPHIIRALTSLYFTSGPFRLCFSSPSPSPWTKCWPRSCTPGLILLKILLTFILTVIGSLFQLQLLVEVILVMPLSAAYCTLNPLLRTPYPFLLVIQTF